jgi:hypothetical protein
MQTLGPGLSNSWKINFVSEYDLIREVLMAYNGCPSVLFDVSQNDILVKHEFGMAHCSNEALWNLLSDFAKDIKLVNDLRDFSLT